ncbi:unnamed protein product [Rotaria socialis]|uniref:Tesmin/TSO1-like CXC domain-containing protein n=1 Tax=Rotaria socialis TaxID=392032 RepID=A0A818T485_9BILA|nr:unnamed protein product [Rotaria socialis]
MSYTCVLCCRTTKINRNLLTTVASVDIEEKIKQAYGYINGISLSRIILNETVHREYYAKYHRRYIYASKTKRSSTEVSNRRLPLTDCTNFQCSSSSSIPVTSTNQHFKENSANETCIFVASDDTLCSNTSSFSTNTTEKRLLCTFKIYSIAQRTDDGELVIRWMTVPVVPNAISLTKCMKCTNGCHRCKCSTNNLSCTPFCGCSIDQCTNHASTQIRLQSTKINMTIKWKIQENLNCEDDHEDNDEEVSLEFIYDNNDDASFISSTKTDCLNDNESQSNLMNVSSDLESSYCYQSAYQPASCLSNSCRDTKKNLTSSPLHSTFESNRFRNAWSPIGPSTNNSNKQSTIIRSSKRKPAE